MVDPDTLTRVAGVYEGSNGDATKALYAELTALGPIGEIAVNLFRAQKNSERAKVYRRGSSTRAAYDTKQWAMGNLAAILTMHAEACGITWGWGLDPQQAHHNTVLYVDLPTGQVSFHTDTRGTGPDYPGHWDGQKGQSPGRVCRYVAQLLETADA